MVHNLFQLSHWIGNNNELQNADFTQESQLTQCRMLEERTVILVLLQLELNAFTHFTPIFSVHVGKNYRACSMSSNERVGVVKNKSLLFTGKYSMSFYFCPLSIHRHVGQFKGGRIYFFLYLEHKKTCLG